MNYLVLVTALALFQFFFFGALVSLARKKHGVLPPATVGNAGFERLYRVHQNTLERLMLLVPLLWMAAQYWPASAIAAIGSVYLVGRIVYWRAYVKDPATRTLGNVMSMVPIGLLLLATAAGSIRSLWVG